ncbi:trypsin-like peptidase domain-containing protein [Paenibacillus sp. JCM 10914]|uniref:S1C family serine protease n=1 Tax=Paenibacillus sp. JCM 10914 TaxID=1236974 RepID=UPI0003CC96AE|nr:trypsin-like peptidase domain-containing protein [Paenibacillus sp. JCM 10914]GAE05720.1 HtrA protease/chaperone protein [Paenibacillus sp. JCM 10914]
MDDQRKRYGYPDDEGNHEANHKEEPERLDSDSGKSSYYYSYGPFQSISSDEEDMSNRANPTRESQEVKVTTPQPVKPIPSSSFSQSQSAGGSQGGGGGPLDSMSRSKQWNYSQNPKNSVKTVLLSFLAGVIVISSLMFAADRTNLFTPDEAYSSEPAQETSANVDDNGGATTTSALIPSGQGDVATVVDQASPAVVLIETLVKSGNRQNSGGNLNDPFWYFFGGGSQGGNGGNNGNGGNSGDGGQDSQQLQPSGIGSGFIFDKSGYILTNEHVIHGADVIQVTVQGNKKPYEAKLLGSSYELDLAVLKIEGDDFPSVQLGDSDSLKVGEWLVAIGNPHGFDHTVTAGVLSSKERAIDIQGTNGEAARNYEHLLQTDASINPGNSGGPLLNLQGEVIGMNVAVSAEAQGIGFAIPASTIQEVLEYLKNNEEVPKEPVPFIGANLGTVTPQISETLGTDVTEGSYVDSVVFRSPAYEADLRQYDIIVGADGEKQPTSQDLVDFIKSKNVGDQITLNVVRNGKTIDLPLTIGDKNEYDLSQQQQQQQP